jgi:nitrile hydratase subunit alpha
VIARAWIDPDYRARLLTDATAAVAELGYAGPQGGHLVAVENTELVHNLVRLHPVFLLSLPGAWIAARLVQIGGLPI